MNDDAIMTLNSLKGDWLIPCLVIYDWLLELERRGTLEPWPA